MHLFAIFVGYIITIAIVVSFTASYRTFLSLTRANQLNHSTNLTNSLISSSSTSVSKIVSKALCDSEDIACNAALAAGLYNDSRALRQGLNSTLLVVAANWAFSDLLFNWICRARLFNLKFLVIAIDQQIYTSMTELNIPCVFYLNRSLKN
jgi:hypothetical protein